MSTDSGLGSVSAWLEHLKAGSPQAAEELWYRYFPRLVALARARLQDVPRRAADEEDVALSAFDSFVRGVEKGRFPKLDDRQDLWRIIGTITLRKAQRLVRDETRLKRGGGQVLGDSGLLDPNAPDGVTGWEQIAGDDPPPELTAMVTEECGRLLGLLPDSELRQIAIWKMEGDTNSEIAEKLNCAPATVERRLALIRLTWTREDGDE